MKNLKLAGLVVGLHALALVLIFVNPGCSSTSKPTPVATDTAPQPEAAPAVALAGPAGAGPAPAGPAVAAPDSLAPIRFNPTRPGTPVAAALEAPPVADVTPATTYVVVKGDSLSTIARHHHLTAAELRAANGLKSGAMLRVGQHLVIPAKAGSAPATSPGSASASAAPAPGATASASAKASEPMAAKAPADAVKHTVKAGETLGSIARHYGVRMGDLATANNIADPKRIRPGQELIIPAKSAGAKSGRAAKAKAATGASAAPAPESAPAAPAAAAAGDLDSGLQPPTAAEVPVVKVDDGTNPPPKNP